MAQCDFSVDNTDVVQRAGFRGVLGGIGQICTWWFQVQMKLNTAANVGDCKELNCSRDKVLASINQTKVHC